MSARRGTSFDEILTKLSESNEFKKAQRQIRPYYDLIVTIINRRKELGFTQQNLAEKAGMHQSMIAKIESGEHDVRLSTLIKVSEALNSEVLIQLVPTIDIPISTNREPYKKIFNVSQRISGMETYAEDNGDIYTMKLGQIQYHG